MGKNGSVCVVVIVVGGGEAMGEGGEVGFGGHSPAEH